MATRESAAPDRRAVLRGAGSLGIATMVLPAAAAASTGGQQTPAALSGQFNYPSGVVIDDGLLYVADTGNNRIRLVTSSGAISTLAGTDQTGMPVSEDGTFAAAKFSQPADAALGGTVLYVFDYVSTRVRTLDFLTSTVGTLAGSSSGFTDGTAAAAQFGSAWGLTVLGSTVYVADTQNHAIRAVTSAGVVTTLAGGGLLNSGFVDDTGTAARFLNPHGICVEGGDLYVTDRGNRAIRKVTTAGVVTTLSGGNSGGGPAEDGPAETARFTELLFGIVGDGAGNLYVSDNNGIRRVATSDGAVTTVAGLPDAPAGFVNATGTAARFSMPRGLAYSNGSLYIVDGANHVIRRLVVSTGVVTTYAGTTQGFSDSGA